MAFIRTHVFHEFIRNGQGLSLGIVSGFIISAHFFIARPPPALSLETLSLLGIAEKLGCSGGAHITFSAHSRHLTANHLPPAFGPQHALSLVLWPNHCLEVLARGLDPVLTHLLDSVVFCHSVLLHEMQLMHLTKLRTLSNSDPIASHGATSRGLSTDSFDCETFSDGWVLGHGMGGCGQGDLATLYIEVLAGGVFC